MPRVRPQSFPSAPSPSVARSPWVHRPAPQPRHASFASVGFRIAGLAMAWVATASPALALTPIRSIQDSISVYNGQIVTVEATCLVDNEVLWAGHTSLYMQDESGRGIQLFDYNNVYDLKRGDRIQVTAEVEDYFGSNDLATTELKPTGAPTVISSGNALPAATPLGTAEANSAPWEGTFVNLNGKIQELFSVGGGTNVTVSDDEGSMTVRVWDSTGIDLTGADVDDSISVSGAIQPYKSSFQLTLMTQEDLSVGGAWEGGGGGGGDPPEGDLTPIASIQDSIDTYNHRTVTVEAVCLIDNDLLWSGHTSLYIQDESGRGIQLFDYNNVYTLARGDRIRVTGEVEDYLGSNTFATTELKPTSDPEVLSSGQPIPEPLPLSPGEANGPQYEGTYVQVNGVVVDAYSAGGGTTLIVAADGDTIDVRVWDSTGVSVTGISTGDSLAASGVVAPYEEAHQLVVLVQEDLEGTGGGGGGGGGGGTPSDNPTIAAIQDSLDVYNGQIVTIEAIVTVGYGRVRDDMTSIYVQDQSGRGINVFNYDPLPQLVRGTRVRLKGTVEEYNGTTELTDLTTLDILDGGAPSALPATAILTIAESNDPKWDGTLVTVNGWVTETPSEAGGGWNIDLYDGTGPTTIRVWETTGMGAFIAANVVRDQLVEVTGIGSVYNDAYQILLTYEEDINLAGSPPDDFEESIVSEAKLEIPGPLFAPTAGEELRVRWNAPPNARVYMQIFDIEGRVVHTLLERDNAPPYGYRDLYWDGRSRLRQRLAAGTYLVNLRASAVDDGATTSATAPIVIGARLD